MRWQHMLMAVVLLVSGAAIGLMAQPPDQPADPGLRWAAGNGQALQEFARLMRAAQMRQQFEWEVAQWEWNLNATQAAHESARAVWVAAALYRQKTEDPQARGVYMQNLNAAYQQYIQTLNAAYQVWAQANNQTYQRAQQDWNAGWQTLMNDSTQNLQRCQTALQQLEGVPAALTFDQLAKALVTGPPGEPEAAYQQKIQAASAQFRQALQQTTTVWQQEAAAAARTGADPEQADQALRKVNQKWFVLAQDALEDYRAAGRAALRRYQLGVEG